MAHARSRRHYRTVEKEVVKNKGVVVTKEQQQKIYIVAGVVVLVAFVKGFIFGRLSK
ncbi:MAG: hypothetical protein ACK5LY_08010 [Lachnospirales bacterium]